MNVLIIISSTFQKKNRSNDTVDRSFNFKNWTKTKEERKKPQPHKSQEENEGEKNTRRKK